MVILIVEELLDILKYNLIRKLLKLVVNLLHSALYSQFSLQNPGHKLQDIISSFEAWHKHLKAKFTLKQAMEIQMITDE